MFVYELINKGLNTKLGSSPSVIVGISRGMNPWNSDSNNSLDSFIWCEKDPKYIRL